MKEYELDNITLMGGWFMPKSICGDLVKFMKNPDEVIAKYLEISKIDGIISL